MKRLLRPDCPVRCVFVAALSVALLTGALLRLALSLESGVSLVSLAASLPLGALSDLAVGILLLTPLALLLSLLPARWLDRPRFRNTLLGLISTAIVFEAFVEYFFFEEFNARFNNIAVDYVLFPGEVVGNVFESYNVPLWTGLALAGGVLGAFLVAPLHRDAHALKRRWRERLAVLAPLGLASAAAFGVLFVLPREARANRIESEILASGPVQLVRAFWTAELDYPLYYRTLPAESARARAVKYLGFQPRPLAELAGPAETLTLTRRIEPVAGVRRAQQVVVVLEESLGSEFLPSLGGEKPWATELDRRMADGLTLRNLIANGNRTVRGIEGAIASFVPLPGDSIVKRNRSEGVATVASVFAAHGYHTAWYYGGYGVFDKMKPFALGAGYQEFIEQSDMPDGAFKTIWGVADEFIFDKLLERQLECRTKGEPLFATLLSVSNHKPYAVPAGRVPWPEGKKPGRELAVRYADWCIGHYLDRLAETGLAADTLVLVVGDHGARVYGAEEIPTESYRIPAVFFGVDERFKGARIERLCSQVDLAPTLIALAGLSSEAPFFGENLIGLPDDGGRAFVHHNRDVGILTDRGLAVLQLQQQFALYTRPGRDSQVFTRIDHADAPRWLLEQVDDAAAVFGTAYELYQSRRLGLPAGAGASAESLTPR